MTKSKINLRFGILALMILLAAFSRLLPHLPNFTPIGGMALFGAAYFSKKYFAFIVPFVALWASNLVLDNIFLSQYYEGFVWFSNPLVFVGFAFIVLLGLKVLKKVKPLNLLGASLAASLIFFLVSNFGTWLSGGMYPKSFGGLMVCYTAAIPFFWNTLLGDLFYVTVLFGAFELVKRQYPALKLQNG